MYEPDMGHWQYDHNAYGELVEQIDAKSQIVERTTTVGDDDRSHRGYTGHEHLAALDLIHMNGRVQDPAIGRFLSPDPLVQAPYRSQSLNRYSYVWNNPLSLVDPSGFTSEIPDDPALRCLWMSGFACDYTDEGVRAITEYQNGAREASEPPPSLYEGSGLLPSNNTLACAPCELILIGGGVYLVGTEHGRETSRRAAEAIVAAMGGEEDTKKTEEPKTGPVSALDVSGQSAPNDPNKGDDDDGKRKRSLDDPVSLRGATKEEVESLVPSNFIRSETRSVRQVGERFEYGWRYANPQRPGDQIRIMEGNPYAPDPLHQGPRVIVSRGGEVTTVPLKGNPVL